MTISTSYDVIVIGAGHAGVEAARASARKGARTALITLDLDRMAWMPCNPAVGGIGKGHIVFEIAAFGGVMPQICSETYLQARMLNTSRGPAVHGLRLQIDKYAYAARCKDLLVNTKNLDVIQDQVQKLIIDPNGACSGIATHSGRIFHAVSTVITTGVFLNSSIFIGAEQRSSGYLGSPASNDLASSMRSLGLSMDRLKTGTPPRLARATIDFSKMEKQECEPVSFLFEYEPCSVVNSHDCYITHTNEHTHEIIRKNFNLSPLFSGAITGIAPRYCPSIETKVSQFSARSSHQVFVEPESTLNDHMYPNGLSTSLPRAAQEEFIRTIQGFEHATIVQPGYAIEYDFVLPTQLDHTLELKTVPGLFLAGQINGTTGYEEAAGQGLVAGINAANRALKTPSLILSRCESYIGIMIDDLVCRGVDEPYRMFTSRAERRLIMRQDNTFERLAPHAYAQGLMSANQYERIRHESHMVQHVATELKKANKSRDFVDLMAQKKYSIAQNMAQETDWSTYTPRALITLYAELLYEPYKAREEEEISKFKAYEQLIIPKEFDYIDQPGLSKELQQKLSKARPQTIAEASLTFGITPAALSLLIFKVRQQYH